MLFLAAGSPAQTPRPQQPPRYGPWHRDLYLQESADGLRFGESRLFVERAGVPCVIRDRAGRLAAVFQWFPFHDRSSFDKVAVSFSRDDGATWTPPRTVRVAGLPLGYQRPFDPTIVQLDDGRYRLYFTSTVSEPGRAPGPPAIYSAVSGDAIDYTFEPGKRFGADDGRSGVVDCSVIRLGGAWHLFAPYMGRPGRGYHAVSENGLTFRQENDVIVPGRRDWIGNPVAVKDGIQFHGSGPEGMWIAFSADGARWQMEGRGGQRGGDPAVVRLRSGRYLRIFTGEVREDADRVQPPFVPKPDGR